MKLFRSLKGTKGMVMVVVLFAILVPFAEARELTGSEILARLDAALESDSKEMSQSMTLFSSSGQQRTRELRMQNKRTDDEDYMLARFLAPADVRGTGLLMANDDMWLYLPALGRVRRIAGHAKQGSFMGSDLSYDDMQQFGSTGFGKDFTPELVGEETIDGELAYKLELTPKAKDGDYQKLVMWVDAERFLPRRIEYFDQSGSLLKVLTTNKLGQVDGRWVPQSIEMQNVHTRTKTVMNTMEVSFGVEIPDSVFTTRNLERGI